MKIQYISDIHLEHYNKLPTIKQIGDVMVLAGDIGYPFSEIYEEFLMDMNNKFKKVFLITGNHEFYNSGKNKYKSMEEIDDHIRDIIIDNKLMNVSYLDNSYEDYDGVRFCGTTLWTQITNPRYLINDFSIIKDMSIELRNELFENSCEFINNVLSKDDSVPIVMISHHLPSYKLIHHSFLTDEYKNYNQCYASNCDHFFKGPIKVWIFGHTHKEWNTEIDGVKFLCNPLGYPGENNRLDLERIVEF
jgi:predicted phosphodiesterase